MAGVFIELILFFLIDVLLLWTGEILVFLCTFGRQRPVFKMWGDKKSDSHARSQNSSVLIGLAFWIVVLLVLRSCVAN